MELCEVHEIVGSIFNSGAEAMLHTPYARCSWLITQDSHTNKVAHRSRFSDHLLIAGSPYSSITEDLVSTPITHETDIAQVDLCMRGMNDRRRHYLRIKGIFRKHDQLRSAEQTSSSPKRNLTRCLIVAFTLRSARVTDQPIHCYPIDPVAS